RRQSDVLEVMSRGGVLDLDDLFVAAGGGFYVDCFPQFSGAGKIIPPQFYPLPPKKKATSRKYIIPFPHSPPPLTPAQESLYQFIAGNSLSDAHTPRRRVQGAVALQ